MKMRLAWLCLPLFACSTTWVAGGDGEKPISDEQFNKMIFFAVLEGLYSDGVSNETVDILLREEEIAPNRKRDMHFIYGCPICMPTLEAMRVYRARPAFRSYKAYRDTFGEGLPQEQLKRLRSPSIEERLAVVQELVERWVGQRLALMNLDTKQRAAWTQAIEEGRKKGAELLESLTRAEKAGSMTGRRGCAICDGAQDAGRP